MLVLALVLSLTGCASLAVKPTDNAAWITGKVVVRTRLARVTIAISEAVIEQARRNEQGGHRR